MSNIDLLFFNILSQFIWTLIDTRRSDRIRDATAAIAGSVVETTHQPGLFSSTTLSRPQANFLRPNTYCWSCKTFVTIYWTHLRVNCIWAKSFCPEKMNNRTLFLTEQNTEVLARMAEKEPRFYKNIARQKMAYAGHALRGSSGLNALLIMEGKISGVKARGRPRRALTDDLKDWTQLRNYSELKRTAEDRTI